MSTAEKTMFLVTGTGHCGTHSFARFIGNKGHQTGGPLPMGVPDFHVPGGPDRRRNWFADEFVPCVGRGGTVWHNAAWVADLFLEQFPQARLVWLVRKAVACVGGLLKHDGGRGFLNLHASWILTPEHMGFFGLSEARRHAWLWAFLNGLGLKLCRESGRALMVRVESEGDIFRAMEFLGLDYDGCRFPNISDGLPCSVDPEEIESACKEFCSELEVEIYG